MADTNRTWRGRDWELLLDDDVVTVRVGRGAGATSAVHRAETLRVERRWFRHVLADADGTTFRLRGLSKGEGEALDRALRFSGFKHEIEAAVAWQQLVLRTLADGRRNQRWISTESVDRMVTARPSTGLSDRLVASGCESMLSADELAAARFGDVSVQQLVDAANEDIVRAELRDRREFFDTIESSPLTEEQARAVICFDNRVQLLAAAGSGKTSVMVARAAYAVSRGFVASDRILMLAFNKAAATELQERVTQRFAAAGIDSSGVRASTFHSFGLAVIGKATGRKPRLAGWLDQGRDQDTVMEIVDELRNSSPAFRYRWDLYRTLFARASIDLEEHEPDGYDGNTGATGYRTFAGEVVKSHGERLIANFLYLNGVHYVYERPYDIDVADESHGQYRPDFFYPEIDTWHEHWGIGLDGTAPESFTGYAEGMEWKRQLHADHGTTLIETTFGEVMHGDGLAKLERDLTDLGLELDWNPDRPPRDGWDAPVRHEDLARLVRTFMAHVKSNSLTPEELAARALADDRLRGFRTQLFLDVYWEIHAAWQRRLDEDQSVDFEDMLIHATEHLESEAFDYHADLVMVDEFQDASRARARLVRALVAEPDRYLLTVGDDWQSINRFAGADLSVMTGFESWFGRGHQLALTNTFRCPQRLCDVARRFVTRNPDQFDKPMRSFDGRLGPPVTVVRADDPRRGLRDLLEELAAGSSSSETIAVNVLGRYRFDRDLLPDRVPRGLAVTFRTIHSSKGLEADHIVIPGLSTGTYGFPSTIADDPVLRLSMPTPERFTHAEERRLLYVALTRARKSVTIIARTNQMSPFAIELLKDPDVVARGSETAPVQICVVCNKGTMVRRKGKYGEFLGCSTFPACRNTQKLE